jgi:hypothetical protein
VLELPHALVGAAIATKIGNPLLSLPIALASHFVLDLLPHWNPHLNTELKTKGKISNTTTLIVAADVLLSLIGGFYIASMQLPDKEFFTIIILGALMGVLPDVLEAPHFYFNVRWAPIEKLLKFQKSIQNDAPFIWGISTQVLTIIAVFWWINH